MAHKLLQIFALGLLVGASLGFPQNGQNASPHVASDKSAPSTDSSDSSPSDGKPYSPSQSSDPDTPFTGQRSWSKDAKPVIKCLNDDDCYDKQKKSSDSKNTKDTSIIGMHHDGDVDNGEHSDALAGQKSSTGGDPKPDDAATDGGDDKKGVVPKKGVEDEENDAATSVPKKGVDENNSDDVKSGKKDLDSPTSLVPGQNDTATDPENHGVSGRKGVGQGPGIVTTTTTTSEKPPPPSSTPAVQSPSSSSVSVDINKISATTISRNTLKPSVTEPQPVDNTPATSLLVGLIFGVILLSVLIFVGFKRLDAIRRRREYRRMNDFLIDGMYNEM